MLSDTLRGFAAMLSAAADLGASLPSGEVYFKADAAAAWAAVMDDAANQAQALEQATLSPVAMAPTDLPINVLPFRKGESA